MSDDPYGIRPRSLPGGRRLEDIISDIGRPEPPRRNYNPFNDVLSTQQERDEYLSGLSPRERERYESGEPGDTGWIDVGSTRVKEIRFVPQGPGLFDVGNLYVRFHKYDTAYVYRGVGRPIANNVDAMGKAGSGIGSYINSVLNGFTRDYCTSEELNKYFGGYGGTYRGPS